MSQSELEANTCSRRQARENACEEVTIGFGFTSDWLRKWRQFSFTQSQGVAMQKQNNCEITFDTQLKPALYDLGWLSPCPHKINLFGLSQLCCYHDVCFQVETKK